MGPQVVMAEMAPLARRVRKEMQVRIRVLASFTRDLFGKRRASRATCGQ
jgi:hypothetical protein